MSRVYRTALSDSDLRDIGLYIARDNPARADSFVDEIIATYDRIVARPYIGRERPDLAAGLRSLPFGRYLIFYRVVSDGIEVVRILHGARDLPSQFEDNE